MKRLLLAAILAANIILPLSPAGANDVPRYELTITIKPGDALAAKGAPTIVVTPDKEPSHAAFDSKEECEMHFENADRAEIAMAFYNQMRLMLDKDYTIEHVCAVVGQDI